MDEQTSSPSWGGRHKTAVLAVFCVALVVACPAMAGVVTDEEVEDSEGIVPIIIAVAFGVLLAMEVVTLYAYYSDSDGSNLEGSDDDEVAATLREYSAQLVSSNYSTAAGLWSKLATNDAMLWAFVEAYFDRMAEIAAATLWSEDGTYDGDKILLYSSYTANSLVYNYNLTSAWNEFTLAWSDYRDEWSAADLGDTYSSMSVGFVTDSGTWTSDGVFSAELMRFVTPTSSSNLVYIDVVDEDEEGWTDRTNIMYSVGGAGTLTLVSTGHTYTLSEGENDLSGMTSGWYELGTGATYISQNLSGSVSVNGLMPSACMLIRNGSDYAYAYESGGSYIIVRDGESEATGTLGLSVSYNDANGVEVTYATIDLATVLSAYDSVSDALNSAALSVDYAGQTAWEVYDALESSSTLISPSSITMGTQTGTYLSTELAAAVYLAALQQLADLGEDATIEDITISGDSLNLICYGDIYYDSVLVAENAVYTPLVYSDATISVGTTDLDVSGIAVVWATGVSSLDAWDGTSEGAAIVSISGATLDTLNIVSDGVEVSSVDLTVTSMERLGLIDYDVPTPTPQPATVDITVLVMIIMILIGAIVALAGWFTKSVWLMIIGAIVAVVGIVIPGTIADLIW